MIDKVPGILPDLMAALVNNISEIVQAYLLNLNIIKINYIR